MSSEMRANEIFMVGRIVEGPVRTADDLVHFKFEGSEDQDPFHCICQGKTANNLIEHCSAGDEAAVEGQLSWVTFPDSNTKLLIIFARHISYGRKLRDLSQNLSRD
jgi:single-stranded DNA-binding protein